MHDKTAAVQPIRSDWKQFAPFAHPTGVSRDNNTLAPFGFMDLALYGNVSDPAKRYAFNIDGRNFFGAELPDFEPLVEPEAGPELAGGAPAQTRRRAHQERGLFPGGDCVRKGRR